jgi:TolC family type I secretion outer membrane protein
MRLGGQKQDGVVVVPKASGRLKALAVALTAATALTLSFQASAQTLFDALASAYTTNPGLDAARAQLRATDESVPQALGGDRPTVSAATSLGANYQKYEERDAAKNQPAEIGVSISQPIYRWGRTEAAVDRAESSVRTQRASLTSTEQSVLLSAGTAYQDVNRAQATLDLNRNNEDVLKRQLDATRNRFEVGEVTRTDVSQAESRVAGATAARIQAEGNLVGQRAIYERVVGQAPGVLQAPATLEMLLPTSLDEALQVALTSNPDVRSAEFGVRSAEAGVRGADAEFMPTAALTGSASVGHDRSTQYGNRLDTQGRLVAELTIPLYQAGVKDSQSRQSRHQLMQAQKTLDQARRSTTDQTVRAWTSLLTARAQIASLRAQVKAAQIALDGVRQEATVGSRTTLDILDAEQELLDAKVSLVGAERDQGVAELTLLSAIGRMTADSLNLNVARYDTEANYRQIRDKWRGREIQ